MLKRENNLKGAKDRVVIMYQEFAKIYDEFMQTVPYTTWADYIETIWNKHGCKPKLVFDLACGTGSLTMELSKRGYEMIGVDKSIRKVKFIDFAGNIGVAIFKGDMPYSVETPEGKVIAKVLKRFRFIVKKVEPKLSKNGVKVDLTEMLLNTISNNKGIADNDEVIKL